jgi:hypothetical protein
MAWPPGAGDPLPRPASVWFEQVKLEWILGVQGHGREWAHVFHVDFEDRERVWRAIADAMPQATITEVRQSPYGVTCGVEVGLTLNDRRAPTLISWHYAISIAAPRLVTAYPIP